MPPSIRTDCQPLSYISADPSRGLLISTSRHVVRAAVNTGAYSSVRMQSRNVAPRSWVSLKETPWNSHSAKSVPLSSRPSAAARLYRTPSYRSPAPEIRRGIVAEFVQPDRARCGAPSLWQPPPSERLRFRRDLREILRERLAGDAHPELAEAAIMILLKNGRLEDLGAEDQREFGPAVALCQA